jgi:hypothetical protein
MKKILLLLAITIAIGVASCASNSMLEETSTVETLYDTNAITKVVDSTYTHGFIIVVTRHFRDDLEIRYDSVVVSESHPMNDTLYHSMIYRGTEWVLKNQ